MLHQNRSRPLHPGIVLLASIILGAPTSHAQSRQADILTAEEAFGHGVFPAADLPANLRLTPSQQWRLHNAAVPVFRLGPIDTNAVLAEDAERLEMNPRGPFRVSIGRDVALALVNGEWFDVPGGRLWMTDLQADGAFGVRIHFFGVNLPAGASLSVHSPDYPQQPANFFDEPQGPLAAGEFWTPTVAGPRARIEYFVPADQLNRAAHEIPFVVDQIQHVYRDIFELQPDPDGGIAGGTCFNVPACFPDWTNLRLAVGRIDFIEGGSGFQCSGSLLATTTNDQTPYFLTANHCIDSNAVANTAVVQWRFEKPLCGSPTPTMGPVSNICSLVTTFFSSDTTLLMVEGAVPNLTGPGVYWAGWTNAQPPSETAAACLHHPGGSWMRLSFANKLDTPNCFGSGLNFILSDWTSGVTQPGSSGSGFFRVDTQQLFGTLTCGFSSCETPTNDDSFGRFDRAFSAGAFSNFLNAGSDDNFENNDVCANAALIAQGTFNNLVVKNLDEDWYRITIPSTGQLNVNLTFANASGDIDMQLFQGCAGPMVAEVITSNSNESLSYINAGASAEFFLRLYLKSDTRATYNMSVDVPLANNNCAQALVVGPGSWPFSNVGSSTDGPNEPNLCNFNGYTQLDRDVWFRFLATCNGTVTISLCGATYNSKLAVYIGCPAMPDLALYCNDDSCDNDPSITFTNTTATLYRVRIGGFQGQQGTGTMLITCVEAPLCPADITGNNAVDIDDLLAVINEWGNAGGPADINQSGAVDIDDLLAVINAWGPCE